MMRRDPATLTDDALLAGLGEAARQERRRQRLAQREQRAGAYNQHAARHADAPTAELPDESEDLARADRELFEPWGADARAHLADQALAWLDADEAPSVATEPAQAAPSGKDAGTPQPDPVHEPLIRSIRDRGDPRTIRDRGDPRTIREPGARGLEAKPAMRWRSSPIARAVERGVTARAVERGVTARAVERGVTVRAAVRGVIVRAAVRGVMAGSAVLALAAAALLMLRPDAVPLPAYTVQLRAGDRLERSNAAVPQASVPSLRQDSQLELLLRPSRTVPAPVWARLLLRSAGQPSAIVLDSRAQIATTGAVRFRGSARTLTGGRVGELTLIVIVGSGTPPASGTLPEQLGSLRRAARAVGSSSVFVSEWPLRVLPE